SQADLKWDTNEPATTSVTYGQVAPPGTTTPTNPTLVTSHSVRVTGLSECSPYVYSVSSSDAALNSATANNGGAYYSFETGRNVTPTYASTDVPVPVPAQSPTPNIATITVPDNKTIL